MIDLFNLLSIIVLVCLGIRILTDEDMIFYSLRKWAERILIKNNYAKVILYPTIFCERCYASFWGTIINIAYWLVIKDIDIHWLFSSYVIIILISTCVSAAFLNGLFWNIYTLIRKHA